MIDDAALLQHFAAEGSQASFTELVNRHLNLVYGAAFRRTDGDSHLAEEIAQQVFATLARSAGSLQRHTLLTGWLYVTTRHTAAAALRGEPRRKNREQQAHLMEKISALPDPTLTLDWSQLRPELDD